MSTQTITKPSTIPASVAREAAREANKTGHSAGSAEWQGVYSETLIKLSPVKHPADQALCSGQMEWDEHDMLVPVS
jgi:hypothetical protein